jgi:hypothetical protein
VIVVDDRAKAEAIQRQSLAADPALVSQIVDVAERKVIRSIRTGGDAARAIRRMP